KRQVPLSSSAPSVRTAFVLQPHAWNTKPISNTATASRMRVVLMKSFPFVIIFYLIFCSQSDGVRPDIHLFKNLSHQHWLQSAIPDSDKSAMNLRHCHPK